MSVQKLAALLPAIKAAWVALYMLLEWWLGRTKRVRASSVLDFLVSLLRVVFRKN